MAPDCWLEIVISVRNAKLLRCMALPANSNLNISTAPHRKQLLTCRSRRALPSTSPRNAKKLGERSCGTCTTKPRGCTTKLPPQWKMHPSKGDCRGRAEGLATPWRGKNRHLTVGLFLAWAATNLCRLCCAGTIAWQVQHTCRWAAKPHLAALPRRPSTAPCCSHNQ